MTSTAFQLIHGGEVLLSPSFTYPNIPLSFILLMSTRTQCSFEDAKTKQELRNSARGPMWGALPFLPLFTQPQNNFCAINVPCKRKLLWCVFSLLSCFLQALIAQLSGFLAIPLVFVFPTHAINSRQPKTFYASKHFLICRSFSSSKLYFLLHYG